MRKALIFSFALVMLTIAGYFLFDYSKNQTILNTPDSPIASIVPDFVNPSEQDVIVTTPTENQQVSSPLEIEGQARGFWFFEASFPIEILDANGQVLGHTIATAQDEWMTEDLVPFTASLEFEIPQTETGKIVFKKDNPSGLPENDSLFELPIRFNSELTSQNISLYFYNQKADMDANNNNPSCSQEFVIPIKRGVVQNPPNLEYAINSLLKGDLTQDEIEEGFTTEFPLDGFSLEEVNINNGVAQLTFSDPQNQTMGGACRVGILRSQIEKTALQFPQVDSIEILPQDLFQP